MSIFLSQFNKWKYLFLNVNLFDFPSYPVILYRCRVIFFFFNLWDTQAVPELIIETNFERCVCGCRKVCSVTDSWTYGRWVLTFTSGKSVPFLLIFFFCIQLQDWSTSIIPIVVFLITNNSMLFKNVIFHTCIKIWYPVLMYFYSIDLKK